MSGTDFLMRAPEAGTPIRGTPGDTLTALANGLTGFRTPAPPVAFRNLTNVAYVDNGGTAPATPDGNIESPFTTFDDANLSNATTIFVNPGNYLGEGTLSFIPPGCSVVGLGLAPQNGTPPNQFMCPLLPELDLSPPPFSQDFYFENVRVLIVGASGNVASVTFRNCFAASNEAGSYRTFVEGGSFEGLAGSQGIEAKLGTSNLTVNLTSGATNRFTEWNFSGGGIIFDAPGGTVELDVSSVVSLHRGSFSITDGGVRVLDGPRLQYQWGATNANSGDFLNPGIKFGNGAAALSSDWFGQPGGAGVAGEAWAHVIHAQLSAVHAEDVIVTLFVGATPAAAAATALTVTIPAGQLAAAFELATELVVVGSNRYMGVEFTSAAALAANALEVLVGLT